MFKDADEDSRNIAVGPALARGMGPDNARMQFYSQNGLRLYVNHTERPWNIEHEGKAVLLPAGGFFAAAPSGLLLLFALHPKSARPFAYAWNPGHSEVLDSKGGTVAGEGLDVPDKARIDALLESGPPAEIIIKDLVHWNWIRIQGAVSSMSSNNQPMPKARSLAIRMVGDPVLSLGRREAKLRCVAIDAKGRERELGTGVEWLSLPRGIVEIDGRHLMTGKGPGSVVVIAKAMGLEARRTINVKFLRVSKLRTHMISSENAVLSYETGMRIHHASLLLTREGSKLMRILFADSDPSGRVHLLHLDSLESGQRYRASIVVQLRAQDAPITIRLRQAITVR